MLKIYDIEKILTLKNLWMLNFVNIKKMWTLKNVKNLLISKKYEH